MQHPCPFPVCATNEGDVPAYSFFVSHCLDNMLRIFILFFTVKTEKKTVQFSDEVQVETIEPEPEPVYIDEVNLYHIHGT